MQARRRPCFVLFPGTLTVACRERCMALQPVLTVNRVGDMSSVQIPSSKYGTRISRDYVQDMQLL